MPERLISHWNILVHTLPGNTLPGSHITKEMFTQDPGN